MHSKNFTFNNCTTHKLIINIFFLKKQTCRRQSNSFNYSNIYKIKKLNLRYYENNKILVFYSNLKFEDELAKFDAERWQMSNLLGLDSQLNFTLQLGPSGGNRGYQVIK
jgi:hypothetical protein